MPAGLHIEDSEAGNTEHYDTFCIIGLASG